MKFYRLFVLLFFILLSGQNLFPQYRMILQNGYKTSSTTFEFDVYIQSTSSNFNLTSYQISLNYDAALVNGGTLSFSYIPASTSLSFAPLSTTIVNDGGVQNLISGSSPGSQIVSTTPLKVGRFRITNTVAFANVPFNISWDFSGGLATEVNINNVLSTVPANHINAIAPYQITLLNDLQTNSSTYEFDVEIVSTSFDFTLTSYQVCLTYNTLITNGGNLSFSYIPGSSTLTSSTPLSTIIVNDGVSNLLIGSSAGTQVVSTIPLTIGRFRITNSNPFGLVPVNLNWDFSGTFVTQINISNTNLTIPSNHLLSLSNVPLPVELATFSGTAIEDKVELVWKTATEVSNNGFDIERRSDKINWQKVGFIPGNGNSSSPKDYSFIDMKLKNGSYAYRLKQIDTDGKYSYSDGIEITVHAIPLEYKLEQNYPNPFNPTTTINYAIPFNGEVNLTLYNSVGAVVQELEKGSKEAGYYQNVFNASGLSSGIYFYSIIAKSADGKNTFRAVKKMILMK